MKKYKIIYEDNTKECELIIESNDLSTESLPLNIISIDEIEKSLFDSIDFFKEKISDKELNLILYELDLMLSAGINFNDSIEILIKNKKSKKVKSFLLLLRNILLDGKNFNEITDKYTVSYLVPAFLELSSKKGNIISNIKALKTLVLENYESKQMFKKTISYPIVLLVSFCLSLISIFYFVVPKFKVIFEQTQGELPQATKILLSLQYVFENYFFYLLIGFFLIVFLCVFLYKKSPEIRYFFHKQLCINIPLVSSIYLNLQVYKIFLIIDIMQKSNYEFHNALLSSRVLLKNQYLLDKILLIENLLQNGKSITYAFSKAEIFDDIILNLLNTAEISNSLVLTVEEIKKIYKNRFNDKIKILTKLVEPIFLITIMSLIVWIVLAVFMPIWDMGNMIKV